MGVRCIPYLQELGWDYRSCHIWDKGLGHVAGNANSETLRKLPVVTEVCVQCVRRADFWIEGRPATMQDWLRYEWMRYGVADVPGEPGLRCQERSHAKVPNSRSSLVIPAARRIRSDGTLCQRARANRWNTVLQFRRPYTPSPPKLGHDYARNFIVRSA